MKNFKFKLLTAGIALSGLVVLIAADHLEAPAVGATTADITDLYAFEGANPDNTVFVVSVQSSLAPAGNNISFDEDVMIEINIDNDGDLIEDRVIQAVPRGDNMYFFGPGTPSNTGLNSTVLDPDSRTSVQISGIGDEFTTTDNSGISYFAGLRDDPFFFDFSQFNQVVQGPTVAPNGFNNPGTNDFANQNVLSVVVEVPNSLLGGTFAHPAGTGVQVFNVWAEAKRKQ
ncbi:DUF4331 family protein [Spongiivirga citrea]|uniref:DUF4331 domain-containing protein n=1 Tax=Spongiivirga citrea TaxID=1481457 RepID=A0A6M0CP33_9FLAO|nr:DUF4331 family protein [Spongiivirga citrea]NER15690.1 DUF4331 domain-containing protein [Spongiivirga citrea]